MSHDQIVSLLNGKIRDRDTQITRLRTALAACVEALDLVRKIPRPWIDGGVTHAEWEGAWVKIDAARDAAQAALTKDA